MGELGGVRRPDRAQRQHAQQCRQGGEGVEAAALRSQQPRGEHEEGDLQDDLHGAGEQHLGAAARDRVRPTRRRRTPAPSGPPLGAGRAPEQRSGGRHADRRGRRQREAQHHPEDSVAVEVEARHRQHQQQREEGRHGHRLRRPPACGADEPNRGKGHEREEEPHRDEPQLAAELQQDVVRPLVSGEISKRAGPGAERVLHEGVDRGGLQPGPVARVGDRETVAQLEDRRLLVPRLGRSPRPYDRGGDRDDHEQRQGGRPGGPPGDQTAHPHSQGHDRAQQRAAGARADHHRGGEARGREPQQAPGCPRDRPEEDHHRDQAEARELADGDLVVAARKHQRAGGMAAVLGQQRHGEAEAGEANEGSAQAREVADDEDGGQKSPPT